jgi:NAD-dependent DNA ligase
VKAKIITLFFEKIGVDGLSSGNIARIIANGFDSITKILEMSQNDFLTVDGFKEKTATKLYEGIQYKIHEASLVTLMTASNVFGRGFSDKKFELILKSYPEVLLSHENENIKKKRVMEIKGMAEISANAFVENIPKFIEFMNVNHLSNKLKSIDDNLNKLSEKSPLFEKSIVMTGFRDGDLENKLQNIGAKVGSSVSKNTFVVLVNKNENYKKTGKIAEAKKIGLPIMLVDEFRDKYNI